MERREPEFDLGLDTHDTGNQQIGAGVDGPLEEARLADSGVAPHDQRAAQPAAHRVQQPVDLLALLNSIHQHDRGSVVAPREGSSRRSRRRPGGLSPTHSRSERPRTGHCQDAAGPRAGR